MFDVKFQHIEDGVVKQAPTTLQLQLAQCQERAQALLEDDMTSITQISGAIWCINSYIVTKGTGACMCLFHLHTGKLCKHALALRQHLGQAGAPMEVNGEEIDDEGDSESEGNSESEGDGNSDGDGDSESEGDGNGNHNGNSNSESEGDGDGESEGNGKGDGESEGDSKGDSKSKGDSESKGNGNSKAATSQLLCNFHMLSSEDEEISNGSYTTNEKEEEAKAYLAQQTSCGHKPNTRKQQANLKHGRHHLYNCLEMELKKSYENQQNAIEVNTAPTSLINSHLDKLLETREQGPTR